MWRSMTNQSELVTEAAINAAIKARWTTHPKDSYTFRRVEPSDGEAK